MGLIKLLKSSIILRDLNFGTYAAVDQTGSTRAIADQARTIRIPVHMVETINKLMTRDICLPNRMVEPTPEEIAVEMEIPVEKVFGDLNNSKISFFQKLYR